MPEARLNSKRTSQLIVGEAREAGQKRGLAVRSASRRRVATKFLQLSVLGRGADCKSALRQRALRASLGDGYTQLRDSRGREGCPRRAEHFRSRKEEQPFPFAARSRNVHDGMTYVIPLHKHVVRLLAS